MSFLITCKAMIFVASRASLQAWGIKLGGRRNPYRPRSWSSKVKEYFIPRLYAQSSDPPGAKSSKGKTQNIYITKSNTDCCILRIDRKLTNGLCTRTIFIDILVISAYLCWGLLNKFKLSEINTNMLINVIFKLWLFTSMACYKCSCINFTHQLIVVCNLIIGTGVRKQEHLRVGVNGEVQLDCVFMGAQEPCHSLGLWFRLWELTAICRIAWIIRGSLCCRTQWMN